jgi:lipopolysaccharide transport system permease protein
MSFNPMAPLMAGFQTVLVSGHWPHWHSLAYPAMLVIVLCLLGMQLFRRHAGDMVDEL